MKVLPVILSGGSGTRLWPVSRETAPKPFMRLPGGASLLQKTLQWVSEIPGIAEILTVTNKAHHLQTASEYMDAGVSKSIRRTFVLEPAGRNTGPAVAIAGLYAAARHGADTVVCVFSADHVLASKEAFLEDIGAAIELAAQGRLVVLGARPSRPETGYGYIELGEGLGPRGAYAVARFIEKPPATDAQRYVEAGRYLWNCGMFVFRADYVEREVSRLAPELAEAAKACWRTSAAPGAESDVVELDAGAFGQCPSISFDYAVVEKAAGVAAVAASFGWSDVGSWDAVSDLVRPDEHGNRVTGDVVLHDVSNTYVQTEGRVVAAIGVRDLVIVDTADALLVADRARAQDVKQVVDRLRSREHESVRVHRTVARPWGSYTVLEEGERFKIKRIVVRPGQSLSLQMHHHRNEHWVVVSGTATVSVGDELKVVRENESTYIPAGVFHRLENKGIIDLLVIEVQSGSYLGEDDIVRREDRYGRK